MDEDKLYQPIEFWSDKVKFLDDRVKLIANTYGFGRIGLELIMKHGKIIDVTFSEEITVRQTNKNAETKKKKEDASS